MRYNNLSFNNNSKAYLRTTENINGMYGAPSDHVMTTGKKRK